uniref:Uncharacterized protein n=1 Tax=Branchiostoma floridae TaxID=7739 RepID=C3ZTQ7_BRAFL|eukprot:XP_002588044.1 hypothetical protein BRAFLDRAFT_83024 [Branchiostoma floridae]
MAAVLVVMTSGQDYGDFDSDDVASMLKRMAMPVSSSSSDTLHTQSRRNSYVSDSYVAPEGVSEVWRRVFGCKGKKLQGEKCHHIKDHDKCCGYMGCFTRMEGAPCTKGGDCVCRPYNPMHMFVR